MSSNRSSQVDLIQWRFRRKAVAQDLARFFFDRPAVSGSPDAKARA
jgi:hypothetical protein